MGHEIKLPGDLVKVMIKANKNAFSSQDLWDCCVLSTPPSLNQTLEIVRQCQQLCVLEYLVFAPVEKPEYFPFENALGKQGMLKILSVASLVDKVRQLFILSLETKDGDVCLRLTPKVHYAAMNAVASIKATRCNEISGR